MKRILTDKPEEVLSLWQDRFNRAKAAQSDERNRFQERERLYRGIRDMTEASTTEDRRETQHIYNIIAENIEAQVDSSICPVKVTAGRAGNEAKAKKIEHRLNDIIVRLPTEELIDMAERTVPIQGGTYWHVEWDEFVRTHCTSGDIVLSNRHPINIIPQEGICSMDDADYVFIEYGATRYAVEREYGIDLDGEGEDAPEARSVFGETETAEDFVTVRIAYFFGDNDSVGKIVWSGDNLLFYMADYEVRHRLCCAECGEPYSEEESEEAEVLETNEDAGLLKRLRRSKKHPKRVCTKCGGTKFEDRALETETLAHDVAYTVGGEPMTIPQGTEIPVYKPRVLPIVLQKSISAPNQLLGISDVDLIEDQQKTINLCEKEMIDRIAAFGSYLILPPDVTVEGTEGIKKIRPSNMADAQAIGVKDVRFDISQFQTMLTSAYTEARNLIGITDSYQGRYDSSAKSGIAKQASAAQAAGRLQSKRIMKAAAWARIYEIMFKMLLAYDDDERDVFYRDDKGELATEKFSRYEFLERDASGAWYFDDSYRFSCDASVSLLSDRETLWQQTMSNYAAGAYGPVGNLDSLIHLWKQLEFLHYPLAGQTLRYMQAQKEEQMVAMQQVQTVQSPQQDMTDSAVAVFDT